MYVPAMYREPDHGWTRFVVRNYPLATLLTAGERTPHATHLPVILAPGSSSEGDLVGTTLLGHLNRANPHWRSLSDGMPAKLVFTGPHGYVSPTVYETVPAAPTWDFLSVHLQGTLRLTEDPEETLRVVRLTVEAFERDFGEGWDPEPSLEYFRKIRPGVGAFQVEVDHVEAMFKLSQEKAQDVRKRVVAWFEAGSSGAGRDLGQIMREFGLAD